MKPKMVIRPVRITKRQRENLEKLARYLLRKRLPAKFDMSTFSDGDSDDDPDLTCGTVGCAVGHGPYAGIRKGRDEGWYSYSARRFISRYRSVDESFGWDWCFDPGWTSCDNTPAGAARRIRFLLEHGGVPVAFIFPERCWVKHYAAKKRSAEPKEVR